MTTESFKLRVPADGAFVFASANRRERLDEISELLNLAGGSQIGPGAFSFSPNGGDALSRIEELFVSLEEGEQVYVIEANGGSLNYGIVAEANSEGGIIVGE